MTARPLTYCEKFPRDCSSISSLPQNVVSTGTFGGVTGGSGKTQTNKPCDINSAGATTPTYDSLKFDPNGKGQWQAAVAHPFDAISADNLASNAVLATKLKFGMNNPLWNNSADAYRHAYWSYTMTTSFGANVAKVFGDAHEISGPSPTGARLMDLYNNYVGRNLATNGTPRATPDVAVSAALKGGCLRTSPF